MAFYRLLGFASAFKLQTLIANFHSAGAIVIFLSHSLVFNML